MEDDITSEAAELSEAAALLDFEMGAPENVRAALGTSALRVGGGIALSMSRDPAQFWSKALGFGFADPR